MAPGIKRQLICFLKETTFTDACNGLLQLHVDQIKRVRNNETTKTLTGELGFYNDDDSTVYPFTGIWLPDKKQYQVTFKEGSFSLGKDEMEKGKLTVTWKNNEYSFLSGPRKRLLSVAQRKQVIGELFKVQPGLDMFFMERNGTNLYEKYDEKPTKNYNVYAGKLMDMQSDYKKFFIRLVLIKPPNNGWPTAAVFGNDFNDDENIKLYSKSAVVVYNPLADRFNISMIYSANTVFFTGYFNDSKGMHMQSMESEHPLFATNSIVGHYTFTPVLLSSLHKSIQALVKNKKLKDLYKEVWLTNHIRFDKELLINNFVGSWTGDAGLLYSNPNTNNPLAIINLVFTIEKPLYVNKSKTIALGRGIQTMTNKDTKIALNSGADGHTANNSFIHSILSYSMRWIEHDNVFVIKFVDMDDTSIWTFTYNEKGIMGDTLETPDNNTESTGPSLGKGNAFVGGIELTKITELPFKPPTYNELYAELKEKELLLENL